MQTQLHVVADASAESGGEGLAAMRYAQAVARAGAQVTLLAKSVSRVQPREVLGGGNFEIKQIPVKQGGLFDVIGQYSDLNALCGRQRIQLIHLHGMWSPFLAIAALVAHKRKIPLVVSPHGCLEPWALRHKRLKKMLAMKIYQGAVLRSASMFVATAAKEAQSIRNLGFDQPVAVVPNGVDVNPVSRHASGRTVRTLLFLSRVHPIKGVLDLVEAWAIVRQPGWRIVIAGGDEEGYRAKIETLIRAKGLETDFEFTGYVEGAQKQACFDQADIFILPTYSENFGIAIAEALANEVPVITTTGAPWPDLRKYQCGWWVEPGVQGISGALAEALKCDPSELSAMGRRGKKLVMEKYTWESIGVTALQLSLWLLEPSRPKPAAILQGCDKGK